MTTDEFIYSKDYEDMIKIFISFYEYAIQLPHIVDPESWALYQTWKKVDTIHRNEKRRKSHAAN